METKRRIYRNNYKNEIKINLNNIKHNQLAIKRLQTSSFKEEHLIKRRNNIKIGEQKIKELTDKLTKLDNGMLDDIINKEFELSKHEILEKFNRKKKHKTELREQKKEKLQKFYKKNREAYLARRTRYSNFRYGYRQHLKAIDTLPQYMRKNLKKMPNNKGYIWRGCWFFGKRQENPNQPVIMIEKRRNLTKIRETTATTIKIYEKRYRERKVCISRTVRKPLKQFGNKITFRR